LSAKNAPTTAKKVIAKATISAGLISSVPFALPAVQSFYTGYKPPKTISVGLTWKAKRLVIQARIDPTPTFFERSQYLQSSK